MGTDDQICEGWGDSLAEKKAQPSMTKEEFDEALEFVKSSSGKGMWREDV